MTKVALKILWETCACILLSFVIMSSGEATAVISFPDTVFFHCSVLISHLQKKRPYINKWVALFPPCFESYCYISSTDPFWVQLMELHLLLSLFVRALLQLNGYDNKRVHQKWLNVVCWTWEYWTNLLFQYFRNYAGLRSFFSINFFFSLIKRAVQSPPCGAGTSIWEMPT